MGYNGDQLEGAIQTAKQAMKSIKKYKTFNLSLLQANDISSLKEDIEKACNMIKSIDFGRYRAARKYSGNSCISRLDHFLAIDDILYNDELNLSIGIDWTVNIEEVQYKAGKHGDLQDALELVVDKTCAVCVQYSDLLDELDSASLAKAVYKLLKKINKAASKYKFAGYLVVDAHDLV